MRHTRLGVCTGILTVLMEFGSSAIAQVPRINQPLVPASTPPGSSGFVLTVYGTGFVSGSVVEWNGSPRPTTFASSTQLTASIAAADVQSPGTAWLTVHNPGIPLSNVAYFEITYPTASVLFARVDYPVDSGGSGGIARGDFNGDGQLDLALSCNPSNVKVLLGNGDGTFQAAVSYNVGDEPLYVAVGDFNGDNNLDLVTSNFNGNNVSVLLGNGDGTFQPALNISIGSGPFSLAVGDFNGDGKLDLAVPRRDNNDVSILLGNGDGSFQPAVNYSVGSSPIAAAVGDFDGDGEPDLAVVNQESDNLSVLLGNGDGTFQAALSYGAGHNPISVVVGDFDGDRRLDLAATNQNDNNVSVLFGNGDGTFHTAIAYVVGREPSWMSVGDINGDGNLDLVTANYNADNASNVSVLLGNGDGTFQSAMNYSVGSGPYSVALGDFNGDGRTDMAADNSGSNSVSVLLQPSPTPTTTTLASSNNPALIGQSVTFMASVASPSGTPTGSVTFSDTSTSTTLCSSVLLDGSGEASCATSSLAVGVHTVTAQYSGDSNFNPSSGTLTQQVTYGICAMYDQTKSVRGGAVFPIKLQLCDANGNDLSSAGIVVHATQVTAISGYSGAPEDAGSANPDSDFRFDSTLGPTGGYIFNLSTKGLASGTYSLHFTAGSDPLTHSVNFGVK